jgi:hypothetical protein
VFRSQRLHRLFRQDEEIESRAAHHACSRVGSGNDEMAIFAQSVAEKLFSGLSGRKDCLQNYFPASPDANIASKIIFQPLLTQTLPPKSFSSLC